MSDTFPTSEPPPPSPSRGSPPGTRGRRIVPRRHEAVPRRRLTLAVIATTLLVALVAAVTLAGDVRAPTVWIEPFTLPAERADISPDLFSTQLVNASRALASRAEAVDEFAARPLPELRFEYAHGMRAHATRALRRASGAPDAVVTGEVTLTPDHADILVREAATRSSSKSRVLRDTQSLERLIPPGAEDVLLATAPLHLATLALVDPRHLADAARLDEIAATLARHASSANDPRAMLVRGARAAARGACADALVEFERAIAAVPALARPHVLAADCYARMNRRDDALARLAAATERAADSAAALSLAGDAYRRVGQPARSLELLRVAQLKDPSLPQTTIALGETLLALHRPAEALAWLSTHPVDEDWRARWLGVLGIAQVRSGQGPAAEATAATLRAGDPASIEAIRIEAELAFATKAWPQALGRFSALRLLNTNDGEARAGEGRTLLAMQRVDDAIAAFRACIDVAPWLAECRLGLGMALREADRGDAALAALAEAAALDVIDPRIPHETARTLRALLRRDEAATHSTQAELLSQRLSQKLPLP